MKIAVAGMGYVGLSLAVLLAQKNEVTAVDIIKEKVDLINQKKSPIRDEYTEKYFVEKELDIVATLDAESAYRAVEAVIVAAPTDYDAENGGFNTSVVENIIKNVVNCNSYAFVVVKSTVPIGFTEKMRKKYGSKRILFSPEFLREGKSLYDNL
ncbi:MAG: UDP-glucose 6-dehydrogenase, partial [Clostridia bacterium]|nr:UDP-glucose 6-dehydrogenase [Clostridia bacterium]